MEAQREKKTNWEQPALMWQSRSSRPALSVTLNTRTVRPAGSVAHQVISCRDISSSSKTGLGKQNIEGRYECEPFIHSFVQQIFTERLPSARPYAWCSEYIKGQKGQGWGSLWRLQSSRGRCSIHQIFSSVLSHSRLSLSGFLCFHSRSFGSCLELHPALRSVHSPPLQPLLPEAPLSIPRRNDRSDGWFCTPSDCFSLSVGSC